MFLLCYSNGCKIFQHIEYIDICTITYVDSVLKFSQVLLLKMIMEGDGQGEGEH